MRSAWMAITMIVFSYSRSLVRANAATLTAQIRTKYGKAQGRVYDFGDNGKVGAFMGIPYARAPSGEFRFQKPRPPRSWRGTRRFTQFGPACYFLAENRKPHMPPIRFDEDCLSVNVFTPLDKDLKVKSKLPVMVYIHGGAYVMGSSATVGDEGIARILVTKNVIVITLNYRTGIFGFFTTGDANAPGNQALWDMKQALEWVNENVEAFGGDVKNIMIFGQSAGGSATHALLMSPTTKGLFHKAAPMSGSTGENGVTQPALIRQQMLDLAKFYGFQPTNENSASDTNKELLKFMQSLEPEKLAMGGALNVNANYSGNGQFKMVPVYDNDFLPGTLEDLKQGIHDVPLLTGNTEFEALAFFGKGNVYETAIAMATYYTKGDSMLAKAAMDFFVDKSLPQDSEEFMKQCVLVVSDIIFNKDIYHLAMKSTEKKNPVFLYTFKYFRPTPATERYPFQGSMHCSDLQYLFGLDENEVYEPTPDDHIISEQLSTYFVNFAKYSDPNGENQTEQWEPVAQNSSIPQYLSIDVNATRLQPNFMEGRMEKWNEIDQQVNSARAFTKMSTLLLSMYSFSGATTTMRMLT
ncbi:unnamed protein product [Bursaphelenchus xylophilus]|uniref:Carboxylic ester hydrolase n=1 Tax=Bursaphelenchus xylophilus TaxID=6326 RepID=A0A1I7SES3_BURXY|nr:unnamed protein product [Bursaphelenchus xylophilus]CAG9118781.1 unnamed protein product [Bursaphelenchus xylophilus]